MALLQRVAIGFLALVLILLALQYIPSTGFMMAGLMGPYWIGILLHVFLLALLALAILGRVPRWAALVPLAVWIAGVLAWQADSRAVAVSVAPPAKAEIADISTAPILVRGDTPLAMALAAGYRTGPVFSELHRHELKSGTDCAPTPLPDPNRSMLKPPALAAREECVISTRAEPPTLAVEVFADTRNARQTSRGGRSVPHVVTDLRKAGNPPLRFEVGTDQVLLPLLVPVLGWTYGSREGERTFVADLWRRDVPVPDIASESGEAFGALGTGPVAASLGLERR